MCTPFSSSIGVPDNSHHRCVRPIETLTSRLEKLSRRLRRSARSCRLGSNWPVDHASPLINCRNGLPLISSVVLPSAKAKRGDTVRTRRAVSICHSQSAWFSSNSRSSSETTSSFSIIAASAIRPSRNAREFLMVPAVITPAKIRHTVTIRYWPVRAKLTAAATAVIIVNTIVAKGVVATIRADPAISPDTMAQRTIMSLGSPTNPNHRNATHQTSPIAAIDALCLRNSAADIARRSASARLLLTCALKARENARATAHAISPTG